MSGLVAFTLTPQVAQQVANLLTRAAGKASGMHLGAVGVILSRSEGSNEVRVRLDAVATPNVQQACIWVEDEERYAYLMGGAP